MISAVVLDLGAVELDKHGVIHESEVILLANVETKLDHHLDPLGVDGLVVLVSLDFSVISSCHLVKNILDALARASPCQFSQIFLAFSSSRTSYV